MWRYPNTSNEVQARVPRPRITQMVYPRGDHFQPPEVYTSETKAARLCTLALAIARFRWVRIVCTERCRLFAISAVLAPFVSSLSVVVSAGVSPQRPAGLTAD